MANNINMGGINNIYIGRGYKCIIPSNSHFNLWDSNNYIIDTNFPNPVIGTCTSFSLDNPYGQNPCIIFVYMYVNSIWRHVVNGPMHKNSENDSGTSGLMVQAMGDGKIYFKTGGQYIFASRCCNCVPQSDTTAAILANTGVEVAILVSPL